MKNYVITFPGQGSQSLGMMDKFKSLNIIKTTFEEASDVIGDDLWSMITLDNDKINQTINTQPIMLAAGFSTWRALKENGADDPSYLAGHSLGEFTALVVSGVISFEDALKIVRKRAELMQEAVPENTGAMAAILGLDDEAVIKICNDLDGENVIEAVNFNSPGQVVVAGNRYIIEMSLEKFKEAGAKRALILPVSVPSHCRLMKPASVEFLSYLGNFNFNSPKIPVIHNADVTSHTSGDNIKHALSMQLYNPVQWTRTIKYLSEKKMSVFVEGGPGRVLIGLNRRIATEANHYSLDGIEIMEKFLTEITT
ncbi:ACP S-malonyltransferase [Methylophilaceae bacterium]|nr:ACP S-malonyltransferase [Methylophilaceae bacterium]